MTPADPTLTPDLIAFVTSERDRREIHDCLLRYARGLDRLDRELTLSAYHEDAIDDHIIMEAVASEFVDWANTLHASHYRGHQHFILNHLVELDGDTAHSEAYYVAILQNHEGSAIMSTGRYVDRFERRHGRWAIARRVCVSEYRGQLDNAEASSAFTSSPIAIDRTSEAYKRAEPRRDRLDVSYLRPLP